MKKNKKQIIVLICFACLVIFVLAFWMLKGRKDVPSTVFHENEESDTVVYGGKTYKYNEHLSNFLFLGIDTREPVETYGAREDAGQADTIFLISLNRKEKMIRTLMIPRDTITNVQMIAPDGTDLGTAKDHINIQYAFGDGKEQSCKLMKQAVSNLLYGLPIQAYCSMNMDGIGVAVDTIGGVEVIVPDDSLELVNPEFKQGAKVTITGENAEQFVRYRDIEMAQSAIVRMNRQIVFVEAFVKKAKEQMKDDSEFLSVMLESVEDYTITNIGKDSFVKLSESSYNKDEIYTIPGEAVTGEDFDEYHVDEDQLYELILQMFYKEV